MYVNVSHILGEYKKTEGHSNATVTSMFRACKIRKCLVFGSSGNIAKTVRIQNSNVDMFDYITTNIIIDIYDIRGNREFVNHFTAHYIKFQQDMLEDERMKNGSG